MERLPVHPVEDLFGYLRGTWLTRRSLLDRATGAAGTFIGTTSIQPDGPRLSWHEAGRISWAGHDGTATRDYFLEPGSGPASSLVVFADGRPFHPLDLAAGSWTAQHLCAPDTYDVDYRAAGPDELHIEWSVNGPRKDLLLRSILTRKGVTE